MLELFVPNTYLPAYHRSTGLGGHADGDQAEDTPHIRAAHLHQAHQVPLLQQGQLPNNGIVRWVGVGGEGFQFRLI